MTPTHLVVLLQGQRIGAVRRDRSGNLTFTYDDAWRGRAHAMPLSLSMPLSAPTHAHGTIEAFLWGLLPDNDRVLERWGRKFQVSARNPFSLLATPVGEDCAGAVQVVSEERVVHAQRAGDVTWLRDSDVADRLTTLRRDTTAWLPSSTTGQFSLAGAQAKTALHHDPVGGRWGLPSGRIPTTHILKPAIAGLDEHDLNEHLCLAAVRRLGVAAVDSHVQRFGDVTAIVIRRYDRLHRDGAWLRVHQEDLCQALAVLPTSKYQNAGGPSPEQIVSLLRAQVRPTQEAEGQVWRFVDALVLNWLLVGTDAHAKNYSLLLAGPHARLAPLYDVASALPYDMDVRGLKMAMKVGGEYRFRVINAHSWRKAAASLEVDEIRLLDRIADLADRLPDAMADAGKAPAVAALASDMPARLLDAVAARAAACRAQRP